MLAEKTRQGDDRDLESEANQDCVTLEVQACKEEKLYLSVCAKASILHVAAKAS